VLRRWVEPFTRSVGRLANPNPRLFSAQAQSQACRLITAMRLVQSATKGSVLPTPLLGTIFALVAGHWKPCQSAANNTRRSTQRRRACRSKGGGNRSHPSIPPARILHSAWQLCCACYLSDRTVDHVCSGATPTFTQTSAPEEERFLMRRRLIDARSIDHQDGWPRGCGFQC
jgi:hypothetical protein